tara:strand:- start:165 stop:470 length:306 start_codon:yes stop_codon:yes gene_type:complete
MMFVNKQTFIYLVVSACIAGVTTTFGAQQRLKQMNQICSAYICGSDLFRDSNSDIGQLKFITCNRLIEEEYSFFPFHTFVLNTFALLAVICAFSSHHKDSE